MNFDRLSFQAAFDQPAVSPGHATRSILKVKGSENEDI